MWGFNGQKMWGFEVKMWGFEVKMWGFKVKDVGIQWTGQLLEVLLPKT